MKHKLLITLLFSMLIWSSKAQVTSFTENFDNTTGSNMPSGWAGSNTLGTNYGTSNFYADHTIGNGRFAFGSNGYFCTQLVAAGTYNFSFWMRISSSTENIFLGYCTNQSGVASTFTSLQTVNNNSTTWTNYSYTLVLPVNAYITWSCYGGAKTHVVDDVVLTPTTGIAEGKTEDINVGISPNPSSGHYVMTNNTEKNLNYTIYNEEGKIVLQSVSKNQQTVLDLSNQPDGIYFVDVKSDKGIITRKLVKIE